MKKQELLNLINENYDAIKDKIIEAYKETDRTDLSGWHVEINISSEGNVWTSGLLSQNSWTQGDFETITTVHTWDSLEQFNLTESIKSHDRYGEIVKACETALQEDFDDISNRDFYDFIKVNYLEVVEEQKENFKEFVYDDWVPEYAEEKIDSAITEFEERIRYGWN